MESGRRRAVVRAAVRPRRSSRRREEPTFDGASSNLQWRTEKKTTPLNCRRTVPLRLVILRSGPASHPEERSDEGSLSLEAVQLPERKRSFASLRMTRRARSALVQRNHRRNAHRATRRNVGCDDANEEQQYGNAAKRERIVTAHAVELAAQYRRRDRRQHEPEDQPRQRSASDRGA